MPWGPRGVASCPELCRRQVRSGEVPLSGSRLLPARFAGSDFGARGRLRRPGRRSGRAAASVGGSRGRSDIESRVSRRSRRRQWPARSAPAPQSHADVGQAGSGTGPMPSTGTSATPELPWRSRARRAARCRRTRPGRRSRGASTAAASARIALNPHWASRSARRGRSGGVRCAQRDELALGAALDVRATEPAGNRSRRSPRPGVSGAIIGSNADETRREVDVGVGEARRHSSDHAARSARPRPLLVEVHERTSANSSASRATIAPVPSVDPLSAMVTRQVKGSGLERHAQAPDLADRARGPRRTRARRGRAPVPAGRAAWRSPRLLSARASARIVDGPAESGAGRNRRSVEESGIAQPPEGAVRS